jgi:hypothetical protein
MLAFRCRAATEADHLGKRYGCEPGRLWRQPDRLESEGNQLEQDDHVMLLPRRTVPRRTVGWSASGTVGAFIRMLGSFITVLGFVGAGGIGFLVVTAMNLRRMGSCRAARQLERGPSPPGCPAHGTDTSVGRLMLAGQYRCPNDAPAPSMAVGRPDVASGKGHSPTVRGRFTENGSIVHLWLMHATCALVAR